MHTHHLNADPGHATRENFLGSTGFFNVLARLYALQAQVQDMPSPEYYVGEFQRADGSWRSTKYCDQAGPLPGRDFARFRAKASPLLLSRHCAPWQHAGW